MTRIGGRWRRMLRGPLIFAAFILALILAWLFWSRLVHGPLPFDKAKWEAANRWDDTTRHRIADGLIESRRLIGLTRQQIIDLLGEPSSPEYFKPKWELAYHLGRDRAFISFDSEHLAIDLGPDGHAIRASLMVD